MTLVNKILLSALAIAVLLVVGGYLILTAVDTARARANRHADEDAEPVSNDPAALARAQEAAIKAAEPIDPALITYHESRAIAVSLREPRALAVDFQGDIYVGGDRAIHRYSPAGEKRAEIPLDDDPHCLTIGMFHHVRPGQIYVGMENHVVVYDKNGNRFAVWRSPRPKAFFTSITSTDREVWVADAENRLVWRFNMEGHLLDPVNEENPEKHQPGFQVAGHYFDVAAGSDELVYIVNPLLLHVEGFRQQGEIERTWGKGGPALSDFLAPANPAHLAVMPSGFATAETGIPRVKVYARNGAFQTVVAGPAQLSDTPAGLAVDYRERVLVLDGRAAKVRIFERNVHTKPDARQK
jgi:hypothetical protein